MAAVKLTKTKIAQGVWQGIVTDAGDTKPHIEVTHQENAIDGVTLAHNETTDHWVLSFPIPANAVAEGVQTLIICDKAANEKIGHVTIMAGEVLGDDIRAEMDLLRAELDMLKRAFRRHCLETL